MRHTLILGLAALLALLVASPFASAQASLVLTLDPLDEPLVQGEAAVVRGTVRYVSDVRATTSLIGVPVQYSVQNAPEWASVSLMPAADIIPLGQPMGATVEGQARFVAFVIAAPDAPVHEVGALEIHAHAANAGLGSAATGRGSVPLSAVAAPDPCAEGTLAAQSAGARPVTTAGGPLLVGALGTLAAAAAGLAAFAASRRARLSRVAVVLLVLVAFGLFVPSASAETATVAILTVQPSAEPIAPGEQRVLRGEVRVVADATGAAELSGMRVHYGVTEAPEWATVVLTPMDDVAHFGSPQGLVAEATVRFQVTVIPRADLAASQVGLVEVVAHVEGQFHRAAAAAQLPVLVKVPPVCEATPTALAAPDASMDDAQGDEGDLSVQSAAPARPARVAPLLAGCAVVGALLGLVVSRRLR